MQDRVSNKPGRVYIAPENGVGAYYATLTRADDPIVVGTPLNKLNLLSNEAANGMNLNTETAVPSDAFVMLSALFNYVANTFSIDFTDLNGVTISGGTLDQTNSRLEVTPSPTTIEPPIFRCWAMPKRLNMTLLAQFENTDVLTVEATNNPYDAEPVWEDCTNNTLNNEVYIFDNQTALNGYGLQIKITITNGATTDWISTIKGDFI